MSHSATVSAFLHINDGPSYPLGKVGPDEVSVHLSEQFPTYRAGQSNLAILEITVDGKTNRRAVFVLSYQDGRRIRISDNPIKKRISRNAHHQFHS